MTMYWVLGDMVNPYLDPYVVCPFCRQALKGEMNCLQITIKGIKMSVCPDCEQEFKSEVVKDKHTWRK